MIKIKSYSITNNLTLTNELLGSYINHFWIDIFNNIKDTSHLLLMCKVNFSDENLGHRTLGHLRKVNFNDKDLFIDYLTQRLSILNDSYVTAPISEITFSYVIKAGQCTDDNRALLKDLTDRSLTTHRFNNMELPTSMNPSDYGVILVDNYVQVGGESIHRFIVESGTKQYIIDVSSDGMSNTVRILGAIDLEWTDTKINHLSGSTINPISPINSIGQATITPNTPITSPSSLSPYFKNVVVDSSTQTVIGGKMVSKMVETTNVLADALGKEFFIYKLYFN